jgi:hypothetical protein
MGKRISAMMQMHLFSAGNIANALKNVFPLKLWSIPEAKYISGAGYRR